MPAAQRPSGVCGKGHALGLIPSCRHLEIHLEIIEQETRWFHLSLPPIPNYAASPTWKSSSSYKPADLVPGANSGFLGVVKYRLLLVVAQVMEHEVINPNE